MLICTDSFLRGTHILQVDAGGGLGLMVGLGNGSLSTLFG